MNQSKCWCAEEDFVDPGPESHDDHNILSPFASVDTNPDTKPDDPCSQITESFRKSLSVQNRYILKEDPDIESCEVSHILKHTSEPCDEEDDESRCSRNLSTINSELSAKQQRFVVSDLELSFKNVSPSVGLTRAVFSYVSITYLRLARTALLSAVASMLLLLGISSHQWTFYDRGSVDWFDHKAFFILYLVVLISSVVLFNGVQFISMFGLNCFFKTRYCFVTATALIATTIVVLTLHHFFPNFWFYDVDIAIIALIYSPLAFFLAFFGFTNNGEHGHERIRLAALFFFTEAWVAAVSVGYAAFVFPWYLQLTNDVHKMIWRLIVQPVYFELLALIPVRLFVSHMMKEPDCLLCLCVVHAQTHVTTGGRFMLNTINSPNVLLLTIVLTNALRLVTRSTCGLRDELLVQVFTQRYRVHDLSPRLMPLTSLANTPLAYKRAFVRTVYLVLEITMELFIFPVSAFSGYFMYPHRHFFKLPFPSSQPSFEDCVAYVLVSLGCSIIFDISSLYVCLRYLGFPVVTVMTDIGKKRLRFILFICWAVSSMGILGVVYVVAQAPDIILCNSVDVCTCKHSSISSVLCTDILS